MSDALRLKLLWCVALAWMGAVMPWLAPALHRRGLSGWAFALAMAAFPVSRLLAGPAWGLLADRLRDQSRPLLLAAGLTAVATAWLWLGDAALLAVVVLAAVRVGVGPLLDGLTLQRHGADYGRVRAWGSAGFLVAVFGASALREHLDVSPLALASVLATATFALAALLPRSAPAAPVALGPALRAMAGDPALLGLMAVSALHFAGHAGYDAYFTTHIASLGLTPTWAGAGIAGGVAVEVGVMMAAPRLLTRFGDEALVGAAVALAIPRWLLTAALPGAWVVPLQAVHGLTFGLYWVGGIALVGRRAPPELRNSAIAAFGASAGGVGAALGNTVGGLLVEGPGPRAVYVAAAGSACAALLVWKATTRWRASV